MRCVAGDGWLMPVSSLPMLLLVRSPANADAFRLDLFLMIRPIIFFTY